MGRERTHLSSFKPSRVRFPIQRRRQKQRFISSQPDSPQEEKAMMPAELAPLAKGDNVLNRMLSQPISQVPSSNVTQRMVIQRHIIKDWKTESAVSGKSRSSNLKQIDSAVKAYYKGTPKYDTVAAIAALDTILTAIQTWKTGKQNNEGEVVSVRLAKVNELEQAVNTQRTLLSGLNGNQELVRYQHLKSRDSHYDNEDVDSTSSVQSVTIRSLQNMSDQDWETFKQTGVEFIRNWTVEQLEELRNGAIPKVDYLDENQRQDFELRGNGRFTRGENQFDTSDLYSDGGGGQGYGIFVMSPGGRIYCHQHARGKFHHSSFLAGGDVAAAGELKVRQGELQKLTNKSGHYKPGLMQVYQVLQELKGRGFKLSKFGLSLAHPTYLNHDFNPEYNSARDFIDEFEGVLNNQGQGQDKIEAHAIHDQ